MWVFLAFLAVAAASPSLLHKETCIRPGKEYKYAYTSQVLSGVSVDNIQYTGLKFKANVKFQTQDGSKVASAMDNVNIYKINAEIPNYRPWNLVPDSLWSPVTGAEKDVITTEIVKPFSFTVNPGKLEDLETETSDPYWSVNVKRGLLSFMQLDLTEQDRVRVDPEELRILNKLNLATPPQGSQNRTYSVMEEDITGKCESVYSVEDHVSRSSTPSLKVTKVKNFDNCIHRPVFNTGLMESIRFNSELDEKKVINWQMEADYELQGDKTNFLIKGAKLVARQHFNRLNVEDGKLLTTTIQLLTLEDIDEIRVPLRVSSQVEKKDSLTMEFPVPDMTERDNSISSSEVRDKVSLMEDFLTEVIEETTPYIKENATNVMAKITELMLDMPLTAIRSLIEKYCTTTEITPKGEILLNTLAVCSRPDSVPLFVKLVNDNIISDTRCKFMMQIVSIYSTSTPSLAYDLMQAVKTGLPTHAVKSRDNALLALGSTAYKLSRKLNNPAGRAMQLETILERIATELSNLLRDARTPEEKMWILRAIGNAGLPELINPLKTIITSASETLKVRVKAIYALRRMAPKVTTEVQSIVIPIYKDTSLPVEMRVAAFIITMQTNPNIGVLRLITRQLNKEPSLNVGSFVYSYLKSMSELKTPIMANRTMSIKTALKYTKPITPGFQYSKAIMKDIYSDALKSGMIDTFEYLNKPNSLFPDTIIYRNDYDFVGFPFGGYEMGLEMGGLQTLVKNVMGPKSILKDVLSGRLSLKDILEPIRSPSPSMLMHIRSIMEKISITERGLQNFDASMYMKMYDTEIDEIKFDSNYLQSLVQSVIGNSPEVIRKLESGLQWKTTQVLPIINIAMIVPSPSGLPLSLNQSCNLMAGVDTSVKVENIPSIRDILSLVGSSSRSSRLPEIKADVTLRPSILMDTNFTVGVELALLRTGLTEFSKIYVTYPTSSEIKIEPSTGILKTKLKMPEQEEEVMKLIIATTTRFTTKPATPSTPWIVDEKIVEFPTIGQNFYKVEKIHLPFCGVELDIKRDKTIFTRPTTLYTGLFGKKIITVCLKPTTDTVSEISLETLYLGPEDVDRSSSLIREILDMEHVESSSSEDDDDDDSWWSWGRSSTGRRHSSSRSSTPFSRVQVDSSIRSPVKHKLIAVLKTHGNGRPEKKVQVQLTHILSEDTMKSQQDLQVVYTPFYSPSSQEKKVSLSHLLHADTLYKWLVAGHVPRTSEKDLVCKLEMYYGQKDYTRKYLDVETKLGRGAPLSRSSIHRSRPIHPSLMPSPLELSIDVEYEMVPRSLLRSAIKAKDLIKVLPYVASYISVESEEATNPPNKVKLVAEFLTNQTEIQLAIMTPTENDIIKGIPIPFLPKEDSVCSLYDASCHGKYRPQDVELWNSSYREPVKGFVYYISGGKLPGKCQLLRDDLETFDKKVLDIAETDCEIILAKDCSSSSSPEFMVTMKKLKKDESKKVVYVYLPEHKIKIEPESGWFSKGLHVEVNDRRVSVPESGEHIPIHKYTRDSRSEEVCHIKKEDEKVVVVCPEAGVKVESDGVDVSIEPSSSYHAQLCGVCSNYNSEPMDDLVGPRKEVYKKSGPFILSYIMSEPTCNIREVREQLLRRTSVPTLGASRSDCRMENKTYKLERTVDKVRETCFSNKPVSKCAGACAEPSKKKETITLHCVPSKESDASRLLVKLRRNEVPRELEDSEMDLTIDVDVPEMCLPAKPSVNN